MLAFADVDRFPWAETEETLNDDLISDIETLGDLHLLTGAQSGFHPGLDGFAFKQAIEIFSLGVTSQCGEGHGQHILGRESEANAGQLAGTGLFGYGIKGNL
jgi:hypothetical protein